MSSWRTTATVSTGLHARRSTGLTVADSEESFTRTESVASWSPEGRAGYEAEREALLFVFLLFRPVRTIPVVPCFLHLFALSIISILKHESLFRPLLLHFQDFQFSKYKKQKKTETFIPGIRFGSIFFQFSLFFYHFIFFPKFYILGVELANLPVPRFAGESQTHELFCREAPTSDTFLQRKAIPRQL